MPETRDLVESSVLDARPDIASQPADPAAVRGPLAVSTMVERDAMEAIRESPELLAEHRRRLRPAGKHEQRRAGTGLEPGDPDVIIRAEHVSFQSRSHAASSPSSSRRARSPAGGVASSTS